MSESEPMTGGCLCGAVRYSIAVEPLFGGRCYCNDCRHGSSTGHAALMAIPATALAITGELRSFAKTADSGKTVTRYFCPICGSGIHSKPGILEGIVFVKASSLDDPERFPGGHSIFASRAPSWDQPPTAFPAFPEMPPST